MDVQVVWQCSTGPVAVSTGGAGSRQAVTDYGNCRQLSFLDAQTGWIATADRLGATTDGGQTWQDIPLPEGVGRIAAISLRTPHRRLSAGHRRRLARHPRWGTDLVFSPAGA